MSSTTTPQERFVWLDSLRLVAGVSMVGLHATADATGQPFVDFEPSDRIVPMLIRAVIYTARTELFLIISIFLLLMALQRRPKTYGETIRIQARRLLVPFAFWTVFFAGYGFLKAEAFGYSANWMDRVTNPVDWVGFFLLGDVKYHMHFIPTLFGLILCYPLFLIAIDHPWLGLGVIVCLLVKRELDGFIYPEFWGQDLLPWLVRTVKVGSYIGYGLVAAAFLGIWRRFGPSDRQRFVGLIAVTGIMLFGLKLVATWKTVESGKWPFDFTAGYWADFLMPVVLFALAMCLGHKRWPQILSRLAPYSFGIYLCHPIFLDVVEVMTRGAGMSPTTLVLVKITFALAATSAFVWCLSRSSAFAWTIGLGALPWLSSPKPILNRRP